MDCNQIVPTGPQLLRFAISAFSSSFTALKMAAVGSAPILPHSHYDIDPETGFIPKVRLERLPEGYNFWEDALATAHDALSLGDDPSETAVSKRNSSALWRRNIAEGPVLSTKRLADNIRQLQRAHHVLAFLVQFYTQSTTPSTDNTPLVVPKTLTLPLVAVSECLGIAPVLTYADVTLWNVQPIDPEQTLCPENMRFMHTLSGTDDEHYFYVASTAVEIKGTEILQIMEEFENLPMVTDVATIAKASRSLYRISSLIEELQEILMSVRSGCNPDVFHWAIRPWWRGSDAHGPESPGWIYEGVENSKSLDLSGPSAGQSSTMHALDIWFDIDHKLTTKRFPAPSESNKRSDRGFMERMRRYMPGSHRAFLNQLASSPRPLRELVRQNPGLREAYNEAVMTLKKFRDGHLRIACLYVITMSKTTRPGCPVSAMMNKMRDEGHFKGPTRGTGGTELGTLLKAGRDATQRAVME